MTHSGVRVAIVDQHELVRVGVRAVLEARILTKLVGEADSAEAGLAMCAATQPDVAVLGLPLRGGSGPDHVTALRAACPRTAVVVLTAVDEPQVVLNVVRAGAAAYLLYDGSTGDLLDVIDRAAAGESYIDPRVVASVIRSVGTERTWQDAPPPPPLTPRELEVLREVARGSANKEIARDLRLAVGTVKVHVERILAKLGAANRADASIRAMRLGLLDPDAPDAAQPEVSGAERLPPVERLLP